MTLTGLKKHVAVLEDAELVTTAKIGRVRRCSLGPRQLQDAVTWIDAHRRMVEERSDRFAELLTREKGSTP